jgi:hypothetical protein
MASLSINSRYRMNSGYEIPALGSVTGTLIPRWDIATSNHLRTA